MMKKAVWVWVAVWGVVWCALGAAVAGGAPRDSYGAVYSVEMENLARQLREAANEALETAIAQWHQLEGPLAFAASDECIIGFQDVWMKDGFRRRLEERCYEIPGIDACDWCFVIYLDRVIHCVVAAKTNSCVLGTDPANCVVSDWDPDEFESLDWIDDYWQAYDRGSNLVSRLLWLLEAGAPGGGNAGPVVAGPEGAVFGVGESGELVAEARNCGDFAIELTNGVSLEMVGIEPGRFTMGSPESPVAELGREDGERPHGVALSHGFWMGRYEVTQGQYEALAGRNPSPGQAAGPDRPVACVTWADAKAFCARLTDREKRAGRLPEGYVYSLPTEAQWEYACRAGTGSALNSGANLTNVAHDAAADDVAWYGGNAQGPQEVGRKQGNGWGLFDMHGNVAEWCADGPWEYPLDGGEETDPAGAARNGENMVRGGSWKSDAAGVRSASREKHGWRSKEEDIGFRVALVPALDRDFEYFPAEWMEFAWCPPGSFSMGSPADEEGREPVSEGAEGRKGGKEPQREVTLTHGFWMGKHEVTRKQYAGVVGGEAGEDPDLPVVSVSWSDATNYAYRLTAVAAEAGALPEGWEFALPTEAQWEYACRALTTNALNSGEELEGGDASEVLEEVGWFLGNSQAGGDERHLHAVGELRPNAWGIYDMHGNAWEWCEDWYDEHPSSAAATNPAGPPSWPGVDGGQRAIRGGGFRDVPGFCRAAARCGLDPNQSGGLGDVGFRLVLRKKRDLTVAADAASRMELLWVKPGSLWLGSPTGETGRAPMIEDDPEMLHPVTVTRGYWLGRREVSRGMYRSVTGQVPAAMTGSGEEDSLPVNGVGRDEALDFCAELTKRERAAGLLSEGFAYTLPTEAQWEFACRAGTPSALNSGEELTDETECPEADEVAWYAHNSTNRVHGPGQDRKANAWGFLDMHGNLEEWVLDWYGPYPESAVDPTGPESGERRILRGGSHASPAKDCRSAARHAVADEAGTETTGFRVALVAVDPDADEAAVHPAAQPEWVPWEGLECQWYKDGKAIEGATGTVYAIESAAEADAGLYRLEACNAFGCAKGPTAPVEVDTHPFVVEDGVHWFYEEAGADRATVVRAWPAEGEMEMPAELAGRTVTAVGDDAFAGCTDLEGMALPDGVTNVGDRAFAGCSGLAWVECPEGLRSIGGKAFQGTGLMAASLPGLERAGEKAFAGCAVLTECTTGGALEGIPAGMFSGCSNLLSFAVADAAGSIGADAFHSCGSLTNLHIGSNVSEVAAMAITNCGALQVVEAPIALQPTGWTTRQQLGNATVRYYGMQKVSFDAAGGTCEPLSAEFDVQGTYGPLPVPSKDGSVFAGWFREEKGARVREGDKVEPEAAVTLTAHWREGAVQVVDGVSWAFCADADGYCATVLGADPLAGAVEMPAELGGLRVAGIASNAFEGCRALQAMRIPAGVVEVGTNAFTGCRQLGTLTVPAFLAADTGNWGDGMAAVEIVPYAAQLVSFEAVGGTCPVAKAGYEAGTAYGWLPEAAWAGHGFGGWWAADGNGAWAQVAATDPVTEEAARTFYARWTLRDVTYYDPAAGSNAVCAACNVYGGGGALSEGWWVVEGAVTNAARIAVSGAVHLILCDGAVLVAPKGITVEGEDSLTVWGQSGGTGTLLAGTTDGTDATGDNSQAGIGSVSATAGAITINGGTVTARGGEKRGAGIGGCTGQPCSVIAINGGTVTATGAQWAAGIGNGPDNTTGDGGRVEIHGGTVRATATYRAAGIGGGMNGIAPDVAIDGGTVTAIGSSVNGSGAGIGGGVNRTSGNVTITGGTVTATPGNGAQAIGSSAGWTNAPGPLTIPGMRVTVPPDTPEGGRLGACRASATVTLEPCTAHEYEDGLCKWCGAAGPVAYWDPVAGTHAVCTNYAFYAGGTTLTSGWWVVSGAVTNGARITVDGDVNLILTDGCTLTAAQGITVAVVGAVTNSLTIWAQSDATAEGNNAGSLTATASYINFAGIGGDVSNPNAGAVTVNGGTVSASCSAGGSGNNVNARGAGIGGGSGGAGGDVTVNGGTVNASCSAEGSGKNVDASGAGIGGGYNGAGGAVTVNGGTVNASCSAGGSGNNVTAYGAGIGGGYNGAGGDVTVNGGTVNASCSASGASGADVSAYGAGIGGGVNRTSGNVTITGGTVTATPGNGAQAIGSSAGWTNAPGPLTFPGMRVTDPADTPEGGRLAACRASATVTLERCEAHEYEDGKCKWCGEVEPVQTVTFDPNGGTCGTATRRYDWGATYGELPEATWALHLFDGWWTEAEGGEPVAATNTVTEEATRTLYAHWTQGVRTNGVVWMCVTNGVGTVKVTGAKPAEGDMVMPETLDGYRVTEVVGGDGVWAFDGCTKLTSMVIADGVTIIGGGAFYGCTSLSSVVIPDGVTTIGGSAFEQCYSLSSVAIPDGVTAIEAYTFVDCHSLTNVTFGAGVTNIGRSAFERCYPLASVAWPEGLIKITGEAFSETGLTDVRIPDSVTEIGEEAFDACHALTNVWLGTGIEIVGKNAFQFSDALATLWVPAEKKGSGLLDGAGVPEGCTLRYYGDLDYYVRADGDDDNDGYTPATAKREISAALAVAGPGNTVRAGAGEYGAVEVPPGVYLVGGEGAGKTFIRGAAGTRCLTLGEDARASGFTLEGGDAAGDGGGALLAAGARMERCIVRDCKAAGRGGAIAAADAAARRNATVENCLIVRNEAGAEGGAAAEGVILSHCTVADNTGAGARDCAVGGSILWGNSGAAQAVACVVEYSLCAGAEGTGCIDGDPVFVGGGDWHLQGASPCIDAMPRLTPPVDTDLDGAPRPQPRTFRSGAAALPDMGCYEYTPKGLFVTPGGTGTPPYDSWENAAPDLQTAVDAAQDGDLIIVGAGTYGPVSVGPAVTLVSLRGAEETVIDAQGASRAVDLLGGGTLEGFTIVNGSAGDCAGILAENGSTVRDVTVSGCSAAGMGGGVCLYGGSTAENVTAAGNTAAFGGGFLADGESTVVRCTIVSNTATRSGGGAWIDNRSILRDSTILGNTAGEDGGGVRLGLFSEFRNNLVKHNRATTGGGVYAVGGDGRDSVIATNTADNASALWLQGDLDGGCDAPAFWNLTIVGNGGGAPVELRDNAVLGNTIVCYNTDNGIILNDGAEATTCWTDEQTDPGFVEPDGPVEPGDRDIHLKDGAPCIGAGTVVLPLMADGYDIDGQPRLVQTLHEGCKVEIGADSATLDCIATPTAADPSYTWRVVPGSYLQLESTPSLYGTWNAAAPPATVTNNTWTFTPAPSAPTRLFYRLLWIR